MTVRHMLNPSDPRPITNREFQVWIRWFQFKHNQPDYNSWMLGALRQDVRYHGSKSDRRDLEKEILPVRTKRATRKVMSDNSTLAEAVLRASGKTSLTQLRVVKLEDQPNVVYPTDPNAQKLPGWIVEKAEE